MLGNRQMSRRSEICIAQLVAGEPIVLGQQRPNIGEMIGEDRPALSEHCMVEWSAAGLSGIYCLYRSVVTGPLTSAKNLSLNQLVSRRTSIRRLVVWGKS